jgi:methylenetetrahydrofolate reductase (NADPH)
VPSPTQHLIRNARYELIPLKSLAEQQHHLPAGCPVSVTCSPTKGVDPTIELAAELSRAGHHAVPHLAARLIADREHVEKIAARLDEAGIDEVFIVGGDPDPLGPYVDGLSLMRDLLPLATSVRRVGYPAYPDHHAVIPDGALDRALLDKQEYIGSLGLDGVVSTQMCFDARRITWWLEAQRARGFTLPVHIGVPGAVEKARLLNLSLKLGIGSSVNYLKKNRGAVLRMLSPTGYNPTKLIESLSRQADELAISGLHVFTFNSVESTAAWQAKALRHSSGRHRAQPEGR